MASRGKKKKERTRRYSGVEIIDKLVKGEASEVGKAAAAGNAEAKTLVGVYTHYMAYGQAALPGNEERLQVAYARWLGVKETERMKGLF